MTTEQPPGVRPPRRPDASMSLLNELFARPLEPGYAEAAAKRAAIGDAAAGPDAEGSDAARGDRPWRRRISAPVLIGMAVLGLLLTTAALQVRDTAGIVTAERESLVDRIRTEDAKTDSLQADLAGLDAEVDELERNQLENSASGQQVREDLRELQGAAGPTAVTGPGVVVTVEDGVLEDVAEPAMSRVYDIDLQQVVNGLWAAGAEAISINGQRLTALTAIRSANDIILVNYRPLDGPYEVSAIGDSRTLGSRFSDGPGGQWLRTLASSQGMEFSVRSEDEMTVPAVSTPLTYAQPQEDS